MYILEVLNNRQEFDFLKTPTRIYQNDPNWVRPLDKDIEDVFDDNQNEAFKHGNCTRWVLYGENDQPIGRIAAFINTQTAYANPQPTGGVGFFECINDQDAANLLFDSAKEWLEQRGMQAMDGPINFGERDSWWGLLIDGFYPVPYKMNYNPPYYRALFETYGFRTYFEQYCFSLDIDAELDPLFHRMHDAMAKDPDICIKHIEKKHIDKYADDFCTIFNEAWAEHNEGRALDKKDLRKLFRKMRPIMDEELIWFAYHNERPIGFWASLPNLNEAIRSFNGRFGLWQKLLLLLRVRRGYCKSFSGMVFGVVPDFQQTGIIGYMIVEGAKVIQASRRYETYEMQWMGDFNPRMVRIGQKLAGKPCRTLVTYRVLFDPNQPFERHPILKGRKQPIQTPPLRKQEVSKA